MSGSAVCFFWHHGERRFHPVQSFILALSVCNVSLNQCSDALYYIPSKNPVGPSNSVKTHLVLNHCSLILHYSKQLPAWYLSLRFIHRQAQTVLTFTALPSPAKPHLSKLYNCLDLSWLKETCIVGNSSTLEKWKHFPACGQLVQCFNKFRIVWTPFLNHGLWY